MKRKIINGILYVVAFLWGAITILPLLITILSSFKNNDEIYLGMFQFPEVWRFENYKAAAEMADALVSMRNSLFLALATTVLVTVVGMLAAYALSRKNRLFFMKPLNIFFMIGVMVPVHCTIVPISNIASAVHAKDQYWFLLLVYTTFNLAQAIFLYSGYLNGIDRGLDEAAIIDGCSDMKLLTKILLPICKPIIATEAIFVFIYGYSELIFSLTLISKQNMYTVSRAMLSFAGNHSVEMGPQFAFVVMSMIPTVIIYLFFHEQVEAGMLSGAVKG
ncbi:MAG: carbohydrate ABC transporter permease [Eubacteriales bacterium]|nr:carbohydrate ABC transporter permease [Eubacteriales bacterium]